MSQFLFCPVLFWCGISQHDVSGWLGGWVSEWVSLSCKYCLYGYFEWEENVYKVKESVANKDDLWLCWCWVFLVIFIQFIHPSCLYINIRLFDDIICQRRRRQFMLILFMQVEYMRLWVYGGGAGVMFICGSSPFFLVCIIVDVSLPLVMFSFLTYLCHG